MAKRKTAYPRSWVVMMEVTKTVEVICDDCTEEQATDETWKHSVSETDVEMTDWDVKSVKPNVCQ